MTCLEIYFDGSCRGGVGSFGYAIYRSGVEIHGGGGSLERCTNNTAEYTALIRALEKALELGADCVHVYGDSQLVVRQMSGLYRVKAPHLKPLHERALELARKFSQFKIQWVPRGENRVADRYSRLPLD